MIDVIAKLKRHRQSTGYFCGPASIQTLLSQFDIETTQSDIAKAGSSLERVRVLGISVNELAKAVHKIAPELSFWVKRDATLEDLYTLVSVHKIPVGVDWQGIFEYFEYTKDIPDEQISNFEEDDGSIGDQGHYCVVTDVNLEQGYVRLADPYGSYSGKDRLIEAKLFDERWWDDLMEKDGGINKYTFESHLMFAITTKSDLRPKEVGMKLL